MLGAYRFMKFHRGEDFGATDYHPEYDSYFGVLDDYHAKVQFAGETARWLLCPLAGLVGAILGRSLGPREGTAGPTRPAS
jgi:hypothetical protein